MASKASKAQKAQKKTKRPTAPAPPITREDAEDAPEAEAQEEYDVEYKTYKTTREHALDRPDMYGGSKYPLTATLRVLDDEGLHATSVTYTPISRRCFTEVLDNLQDAGTVARERGLPIGRQEVTLSQRRISVYNESGYIPIKKQPAPTDGDDDASEVWKPFACFGTLMTSSNYDDDAKRNVAGRNGIGAKIAPIFSSWFELDVRDPSRRLRYTQVWRENASVVEPPIVEPWTDFSLVDGRRCGSVRVSWVVSPASGVSEYTPEVLGLFRKAVADASYTSDVPIELIEYADGDESGWVGEASETSYDLRGERYLALYPKLSGARSLLLERDGSRVRLFDTPGAAMTESFVNNGCTPKGGVHVHAWRQWLYRALHAITVVRFADKLAPKKGAPRPKEKEMTDKGLEKLYGPHVSLVLACTLDKPTYDGQAKEECTGPAPALPSVADIAADEALAEQLRALESWRVFDEVEAALDAKARRKANKDNGRKTEFVDVAGAEDAEWAGTKMSGECSLILCEGDSGKTTAIKGSRLVNPKAFGVYTIDGKIANFMQHPAKSADVVRDLKKLLGWAPGKARKDLRYGKLQIMTDADPDGVHIRLLAIAMIYVAFPGLIEDGFVEAFIFPIVTLERRSEKLGFYTMQEYEHWAAEHENGRGYTHKYFKGLGSCNDADVTYAFTHPLVVRYLFDEYAEEALRLAFDKGQEDERKDWLVRYDPKERFVYPNVLEISTSVIKELPIFAIYDTERCIPSLMDGLNIGQRKVVHIVRKNNVTTPIKTKQLSGLVANGAAYHHNEDILEHTITRMNWTFPGSNNVPLLRRSGEFGSRRKKGKDASAGRYTFTSASPILKVTFTEEDDLLLEWNRDGEDPIEPRYFYSVLAIVLANCQKGIGVGSNCDIPCYDPEELLRRHRAHCEITRSQRLGQALVRQPALPPLLPWARHYGGAITLEGGKVIDRGVFAQRGGTIHVTEVPLKMSFEDYEEKLNKMKATPLKERKAKKGPPRETTAVAAAEAEAEAEEAEANDAPKKASGERKKAAGRGGARVLKSHKHEAYDLHENGDDHCHFELREFALMPTHKALKLECTIPTSMMTVFDERGKLRHFDGPEQLLEHYSGVMIESREVLRVKLVQRCRERTQELELKARFVAEVVRQPTLVAGRKDVELNDWMTVRSYPRSFLDMRLASITERMQTKLNEQLASERALLRHYDEMRGEELWLEQLARFEEVYERLYA